MNLQKGERVNRGVFPSLDGRGWEGCPLETFARASDDKKLLF